MYWVLEVIVLNYSRIVLDFMFVNTFSLVELLICGTVLITLLCVVNYLKINDKLKTVNI